MVQLISSIIDIRTSCYAARLAAFSYPQKHCKALFFEVPLIKLLKQSPQMFLELFGDARKAANLNFPAEPEV
jgi:hypothetical protein